LVDLRGIYGAIKDGEATWKSVMENKAEQGGGDSEGVKTIPVCTAEKFEAKSAEWRKLIVDKKKTVADLVAMIETKDKLTEDQKLTIDAWSHEND
jgi:hypothetical protein